WAMDTDLSDADASFRGEDGNDCSGYAVSGAGDVNGDGYDDFLIGAHGDDDGGSSAGQTYLLLSSVDIAGTAAAISDDTWHHVAGTFDGSNVKIYVDGVLKDTEERTANIVSTTADLNIGIFRDGVNKEFKGKIDEVRIWNDARTETEIRTNMCKTLAGNETGLVAYYKMTDGSGTSLTDNSTNSNTGTLTNMDDSDWVTSGAALGDASTYDYSTPTSVNLASGYGDDVTVGTIVGSPNGVQIYRVDSAPNVTTPPGGLDQLSQSHYFGVFVVGGTSPTYTLTYNYDGHPGISNENNLELASRSNNAAASWTDLNVTPDTEANTLTKTLQTGTEYILGSTGDNSLPVELASFTATAGNGKVKLHWITESEIENLGFNMYCSANSNVKFLIINDELIPGVGSSSQRHEYEYVDKGLTNGVTYRYKLEDVDYSGNTELHGPVSATPIESAFPAEFRLYPNYPNPFNPVTTISYDLPDDGFVELSVYNMRGEKVTTLMQGNQEAGSYRMNWDGTSQSGDMVASGIYFLRIASGSYSRTSKMIFIR
ncbi:MAG: T9SS type A sorting domain-containing protein, partial [Candidatus Marinimicrobia bacterium]|nr:T9SS type A sorting domain-containing protein [Candidatus Neomarinimicrobiota bacterium]